MLSYRCLQCRPKLHNGDYVIACLAVDRIKYQILSLLNHYPRYKFKDRLPSAVRVDSDVERPLKFSYEFHLSKPSTCALPVTWLDFEPITSSSSVNKNTCLQPTCMHFSSSVIFVLIYFLVLVLFQFYQTCWRRSVDDLPKYRPPLVTDSTPYVRKHP